jgi:hypothetical protein
MEIARAVAARKRIIPVLVDGGRLPAEAGHVGAQSPARLQYCEIGRRTFKRHQGLARTLSAKARRPIRPFHLPRKGLLVVVPVVSAVLYAVAWSISCKGRGLVAKRITWLGDGLRYPLSDQLRIVSSRSNRGTDRAQIVEGAFATRSVAPRRFAALLDELVRRGASRVVVPTRP